MEAAESCREQLESLNVKLKEAREQLKQTEDSDEKTRLKNRIRSINQALTSVREQLRHFDPEGYQSKTRSSSSQMKKRVPTFSDKDGVTQDFFSRSKEVWSDLDGKTWQQIEDEQRANDVTLSGYKKSDIEQYMVEACERLTDRQKIYINEYFNEGKSFEMIADDYGVDKSTVCRVVKNGLRRIQDWVDARISIKDFQDKDGSFDWKPYLEKNNKIVSDRQRELLLLVLSRQAKTKKELADKLNLKQSTVVRTLQKASKTVVKLELKGQPTYPVRIEDWTEADVFSIALQLDMPLNFYYKYCFDRNKRYNGLTRYTFEVTKRVRAGKTAEQISDEFGISVRTAKGIIGLIKRKNYVSKVNKYSGNEPSISDLLSDSTYVKLQHLVTRYDD